MGVQPLFFWVVSLCSLGHILYCMPFRLYFTCAYFVLYRWLYLPALHSGIYLNCAFYCQNVLLIWYCIYQLFNYPSLTSCLYTWYHFYIPSVPVFHYFVFIFLFLFFCDCLLIYWLIKFVVHCILVTLSHVGSLVRLVHLVNTYMFVSHLLYVGLITYPKNPGNICCGVLHL